MIEGLTLGGYILYIYYTISGIISWLYGRYTRLSDHQHPSWALPFKSKQRNWSTIIYIILTSTAWPHLNLAAFHVYGLYLSYSIVGLQEWICLVWFDAEVWSTWLLPNLFNRSLSLSGNLAKGTLFNGMETGMRFVQNFTLPNFLAKLLHTKRA